MSKMAAIILAAGLSRRMGKPKLFLPYLNVPLIHYPVSLAVENHFDQIIVVGGRHIDQLHLVLKDFTERITIIFNPEYELGMSTSLKAGINALNEDVEGVLLFLGDQPFVTMDVIEKLIHTYELNKVKGMKIVRPRFINLPGHPALFDRSLFQEFRKLYGDEGGKRIIKAHEDKLIYVDFNDDKLNLDIDTMEEYKSLIKDNPS